MQLSRLFAAVAAASLLSVQAAPLSAQSLGDRLKRKVQERVDRKTDEGMDKALDKAEETVKCAATDSACIAKAKAEGKKVETTGAKGAAAAGANANATEDGSSDVNALKPGTGAWANYDFKPGERILFFDDFTKDEVGDFPRRMEFQSGSLELVDWQGGRWLRASSDSKWYVPLPEVRPDRFTMEFDYYIPSGEVWIYFGEKEERQVDFGGHGHAALSNRANKVQAQYTESGGESKIRRGRIMVDGKYAKVYLDEKRVLNVPNADLERTNKILFYTDGDDANPSLFGNFRLAAGGKKLYDVLAETGRVATQGIYFDTGSDRIRPESSPTLKEIAAMLTEHGDLSLTIEGHTDNVGSAATNKTLSEKRAAAVKAALVGSYGVEAGRLETAGFGSTKPAGSNDTPEGRQTNRRVELVRR
jgi:Outer membrane protein and related peptidoglycan-associated (lipo)proteins